MAQIEMPSGHVRDVNVDHRKRKCKYPDCETQLSSYNLNDFCFAHARKGAAMEWKNESERKSLQYKAYKTRKSKHK